MEYTKFKDLNIVDREWFEGRVGGNIPQFKYLEINGLSYFDMEDPDVRICTMLLKPDINLQPEDDYSNAWLEADQMRLEEWSRDLEDEGNPKVLYYMDLMKNIF